VLSKGHSSAINDVFFPPKGSNLFVTCSASGFHVWNSKTYQELLRVDIPRSECNSVAVPADGLVILTGWADGRIRGYLPQSGKELWVINEAHLNGVTAITCSGNRAITGGMTGDICVWQLNAKTRNLVKTPKGHHQEVTQIRFSKDGNEFISSSPDGSVILWDANRLTSRQRFLAQTFFNGADKHAETGILVTVSSDKRIVFWDCFNANVIRELEASINGMPTSVDLAFDGSLFVTGGDDKLVKWRRRRYLYLEDPVKVGSIPSLVP
jgi:WD40 repeat protein